MVYALYQSVVVLKTEVMELDGAMAALTSQLRRLDAVIEQFLQHSPTHTLPLPLPPPPM